MALNANLDVIVLFGPDGAGKSTIAKEIITHPVLRNHAPVAVSGTRMAEWPRGPWHDELETLGVDDVTHAGREHLLRKIGYGAQMVATLADRGYEPVVLDSSVFHKTLAYNLAALGPEAGVEDARRLATPLQTQLGRLALPNVVSVYVTTCGPDQETRATEIHERLGRRAERSTFDPTDPEGSIALVQAYDTVSDFLSEEGYPSLRIYSGMSLDEQGFGPKLQAATKLAAENYRQIFIPG